MVGFVKKERKRAGGGGKLLYERDANEIFSKNPNCLKGVFVKCLFKLLLPVKSIRFT